MMRKKHLEHSTDKAITVSNFMAILIMNSILYPSNKRIIIIDDNIIMIIEFKLLLEYTSYVTKNL